MAVTHTHRQTKNYCIPLTHVLRVKMDLQLGRKAVAQAPEVPAQIEIISREG